MPGKGERFVFRIVGAVEVRRLGFELGGAGVDHLVDGEDAPLLAKVADLFGQPVCQRAYIRIRKSQAFRFSQEVRCEGLGQEPALHPHDGVQLVQKPRVDTRHCGQLGGSGSPAQ